MKRLFLILTILVLATSGCNKINVKFTSSSVATSYQRYFIENLPDGTGVPINGLSLEVGEDYTFYAIERTDDGNYVDNLAVSWAKNGPAGDLTILGGGESAFFDATAPGVAQVAISVNGVQVEIINITVTPPAYSPLDVSNLVISNLTSTSFRATIDFTGGSPAQSHIVYYCNASITPTCDPTAGGSAIMTVSGATYTANITGLTNPTELFNVRVISTDTVAVTGSPLNSTATLSGTTIAISNLVISDRTKDGMNTTITFSGDAENNSSLTLYFCNRTTNSSCDPLLGTSLPMVRGATTFSASISGLDADVNFSEGDQIHLRVVAVDPDGTSGSPLTTNAYLADLIVQDLSSSYHAKDAFNVSVGFTETNTNGTVVLYYCNHTLSTGCNPLGGNSVAMTRGATTFTATVVGLTGPNYNEADEINISVVAADPEGVRHVGSMTRTLRLTGIITNDLSAQRIQSDSFYLSMTFSGDQNNNQQSLAYYCNRTNSVACDPLGESPVVMSKSGSSIGADFTNLLATNDPGDILLFIVQTTDVDGVYADSVIGSPSTMELYFKVPDTKDIFRSVAPGVTTSLANYTSTANKGLTLNAGVATFSGAGNLPSNIGVGDALVFDSNGAGPSLVDTIVFIHERINANEFNVRLADGSVPPMNLAGDEDWSIYRAYTSLDSAIRGTENSGIPAGLRNFDTWVNGVDISSQTGLDHNWHIALYAGSVDDQTPVQIAAPWKNDWVNKIHIFTPVDPQHVGISQRHIGAWNPSLYVLRANQRLISSDYIHSLHIEGVQLHLEGSTNSIIAIGLNESEKFVFTKNLIQSSSTGTSTRGLSPTWSHKGVNANNVYFGFSTVGSIALELNGEGNNSENAHYNNTFVDVYHAIRMSNYHNYVSSSARNNLALSCIDECYKDLLGRSIQPRNNASSDNSASTITNASGTSISNIGPASDHLVDPDNLDFRLLPNSSIIGAGMNLSTDDLSIYSFNEDIQSQARGAVWDIGADQN